MHLDIATLSLVLLLVYLGNTVLSVLLAWSGRKFTGAWVWVLGQGLMSLGAATMVFRPSEPQWMAVVVGNGFYISSLVLFAHAIWVFRFQTKFPRWVYGLVLLVFATFWLALDGSFALRSQIYSVWALLCSSFAALLLVWRVERGFRLANGVTALPFLGTGVASLLRLFLNVGTDRGKEDFYHLSTANALYLLGAILISTVTLFGYFMMTGIRSEQISKRKDEEIEARSRKLLESNRSKDLFFSIIAHDLRGPISGAARYTRKHLLGKMTGLETKFNEVETLASALDKTNEFLEKLLWWSRAQLEDWVPTRQILDLTQVLNSSADLVRSAAELKEISLLVPDGPFPRPVADPESVQMILGNLLSNAVKFSLPGRTVRMEVAEGPEICRIIVTDEGVGMDRPTLDRLFRIEDKLTTHGTAGERGSGMGLLLAKSLAQRNGGELTMESEPGIGTLATLELSTSTSELPT